jgi:hypothetical protein
LDRQNPPILVRAGSAVAYVHNEAVTADGLEYLAGVYARFAANEASGRSPLYEELARGIAGDREVLVMLAQLPPPKQQPNLLLASMRYRCGLPAGWQQARGWLLDRRDEIVATILARRTQTNEPARCATLLPLLCALPQPLALLEVGAAAGLCLLPDRYAYDYDGHRVAPSRTSAVAPPTFRCQASASTPLPARNVDVAWRAGLDLEPLDVCDRDQSAWLEALVWPSEGHRLELLRAALDVASVDPPPLTRGDLLHDLPALACQAPPDATLVVFHTAVLAYVPDPDDRAAFAETVGLLDAVWVANEAPGLLDQVPSAHPWPSGYDPFLLTCNRHPVAWVGSHGESIDWLP